MYIGFPLIEVGTVPRSPKLRNVNFNLLKIEAVGSEVGLLNFEHTLSGSICMRFGVCPFLDIPSAVGLVNFDYTPFWGECILHPVKVCSSRCYR